MAGPWMHEVVPVTQDIEVLLSQDPPLGILDENTGCTILCKRVATIKLTDHLFGQLHSSGGNYITQNGATFYNVSGFPQI